MWSSSLPLPSPCGHISSKWLEAHLQVHSAQKTSSSGWVKLLTDIFNKCFFSPLFLLTWYGFTCEILLAYSSLTETQNYWKNRISRIRKTISQVVSSKMFTTEVKDKLVVMTRMAYKPITSHWSRVREDSLSPFTWDVQRCRNSNFANSLFSHAYRWCWGIGMLELSFYCWHSGMLEHQGLS